MSMAAIDKPAFRAALDAPVPALALREVAAETLATDLDGDREALLAVLERLRQHYRRIGREDAEDVILEVMDFASGWCRPDLAL